MTIGREQIRSAVCKEIFGSALVQNAYRGVVAEAIVAMALPDWRWCASDWKGWDLVRPDGFRLEVKQSAVRQTWTGEGGKPTLCRFDIRARKGHLEHNIWIAEAGRNAEIYVFAHHFVFDADANHFDPAQWRFHAIAASRLPQTATIGINRVTRLAPGVVMNDLREAVDAVSR